DLVVQTRARGVVVLENHPLTAVTDHDAVAGGRHIRFGAIVCADGAGGASRRLLGFGTGIRAPLREALTRARGQDALVFDLDAGPGGYAWRFPCVEGGREVENCGVYAYPGWALADGRACSAGDLRGALATWA